MLDKTIVNTFAHVKPGDTPWVSDGLRDFFLYRDLGIAERPAADVIAVAPSSSKHLRQAAPAGTGMKRNFISSSC